MRITVISFFAGLVLLVSCSVKEDRIDCPCAFSLDLTACIIYDDVLTFSLWDDNNKVVSDYYYRSDLGKKHEYELARKTYVASAFSGDVNSIHSGRNILVKKGMQSDSLYACASVVDAMGENTSSLIVLNKQFAVIRFDMSEYEQDGSEYTLRVTGNYGGMDILTLEPVTNIFEYELRTDGSGNYPVRIPRQGDDGLALELFCGGKSLAVLAVGKEIRRAGYDWSASDLKDMTLEVSSLGSMADVKVNIHGWSSEERRGNF